MSGATTKGFPYPTGSDRVRDGDNAIQSLAQSVDTYLNGTAWVYPALLNGWTTQAMPETIGYMRDGAGNVHLQGVCANGTALLPIFILPVGFRPPSFVQGGLAPNAWGVNVDGSFTGTPGTSWKINMVYQTRARV